LIPVFIVILFLVVTWKKSLLASIFFLFTAMIFTIFFNTYRELLSFLFISGPVFLVSVLYFLDYKFNKI
jgi:hypothetical protein